MLLFGLIILVNFLSSCKKDDPEPPIEISFGAIEQSVQEGAEIKISLLLERPSTTSGKIEVQLAGDAVYTKDYNTNPSGNLGTF